jgi:prepilin-type N-terminal cleavage/methylation domain-containing protein
MGTMQKIQKKEKGFTIIEVVLVLAIAGLIFMVVFLALPGLQRSQRDTQRKQDIGRLVAQITTYQGNNKGRLPCAGQTAATGAVGKPPDCLASVFSGLVAGGSSFVDPSVGQDYIMDFITSDLAADDTLLGTIYYALNANCGGTTKQGTGDDAKTIDAAVAMGSNTVPGAAVVVATRLEGGDVYCQQG